MTSTVILQIWKIVYSTNDNSEFQKSPATAPSKSSFHKRTLSQYAVSG